jgi:cellulose synthase/poly-beta-1,6-N-acetylglucosamine synthase-like glycosyltransferase
MPFPLFQPSSVYGAGSPHPLVDQFMPALAAIYLGFIGVLMLFSVHLYAIVLLRRRLGRIPRGRLPAPAAELPSVTVQIPIYNEGQLAVLAVEAAAALDYPRDKLEILMLDGSTDDTPPLVAAAVQRACQAGVNIRHYRRDNSIGYKAGALIEGCELATGELIAVFDADFFPGRDFLRRVAPHFTDPRIGCVQTRWDHRNAQASALTASQAIILDAFYGVEAPVRSHYNLVTFFTGTCGVWRKSCIIDAGGWQADTLAEDMDLSLRAQMRSWQIVYDQSVATSGELPENINGFLRQQHRWTMGHTQVCCKLLGRVLRSPMPLRKRGEAALHMLRWLTYPSILGMALLMMPALILNPQLKQLTPLESLCGLALLLLATGSASIFYGFGQMILHPRSWWRTFLYMPALMALGLAMAPNNCRAIFMALTGRHEPFRKTPRVGEAPHTLRGSERYIAFVNLGVGLYLLASVVVTVIAAFRIEAWSFLVTAGILALFAGGLLLVSYASLRSQARASSLAAPAPSAA